MPLCQALGQRRRTDLALAQETIVSLWSAPLFFARMSHHHHADHTASSGDDPTFKARKRSTGEVVRRVWVYVRPYYRLAFATIACAVLSLIFALIYPKLTQSSSIFLPFLPIHGLDRICFLPFSYCRSFTLGI